MMEDSRVGLGNQFVGLQTQWWRMRECQSIHWAPKKMVRDARTTLGNQIVGYGVNGGGCMNDNQFMGL